MLSEYLVIGEILKPQGVRGELKVRPITCDPMRFEDLDHVFIQSGNAYKKINIKPVRIDRDAVYLLFEGVRDRNTAETWRGQILYIDRKNAVELPDDTEFICDLIGCVAIDDEGKSWGTLTEVLQPGASDVYVLKGAQGQVLVPALKSVVLNIDVHNKTMLLCAKRLREVAVLDDD